MYINLQKLLTVVISILLIVLYFTHSVIIGWILAPIAVLVLLISILRGPSFWNVEIGFFVEEQ